MAVCSGIQIAGFDLLDVVWQELNAMRIDAAQICGNQRIRDQPGFALGHGRRFEDCFGEVRQLLGAYLASDAQRISSSLRI